MFLTSEGGRRQQSFTQASLDIPVVISIAPWLLSVGTCGGWWILCLCQYNYCQLRTLLLRTVRAVLALVKPRNKASLRSVFFVCSLSRSGWKALLGRKHRSHVRPFGEKYVLELCLSQSSTGIRSPNLFRWVVTTNRY